MATWAAQLQSIQQLGTRLSRLSSVAEIGHSITTELRQLIDYHNARVYRLEGADLIPVAMQGQVGEYVDETPDQLRVALGVRGSPAGRRQPDRPEPRQRRGRSARQHDPGDAGRPRRPMLLAPMLFDDQVRAKLVLEARLDDPATTTSGSWSSTPASQRRRDG
jgi:hypothetical protein